MTDKESVARLRKELEALRSENERLQSENFALRREGTGGVPSLPATTACTPGGDCAACEQLEDVLRARTDHSLSPADVARYSRQLLLPSFGVKAQEALIAGSVLVIGAGGLGSPAALYLAAAGVGRLGIVDQDVVELNNLHRQIIHREATCGAHKADSAAAACSALNSSIKIEVHRDGLTPANAVALVSGYDVVVDASDNAPTRYLASDACASTGRPLVSGAAIGTDGQLTVYGYEGGACYRCLFPECPAPRNCSRCSEAGVLGPVPGAVGAMQALEAIKLLSGVGAPLKGRMLVMDMLDGRVMSVKLRGRSPSCIACGDAPAITADNLAEYDYAAFTGGQAATDDLPERRELVDACLRLAPADFLAELRGGGAVLLDVRPPQQFAIGRIAGFRNIPFEKAMSNDAATLLDAVRSGASPNADANLNVADQAGDAAGSGPAGTGGSEKKVLVVCRRGMDSQVVVETLTRHGYKAADLAGGLEAWAQQIDPSLPAY